MPRRATPVELDREGRRVCTHWMLYRGRSGLRRVSLSMRSAGDVPEWPDGAHLEEVTAVLGPLRELTARTGARLFVDGADVTDEPWDEVVGLLT